MSGDPGTFGTAGTDAVGRIRLSQTTSVNAGGTLQYSGMGNDFEDDIAVNQQVSIVGFATAILAGRVDAMGGTGGDPGAAGTPGELGGANGPAGDDCHASGPAGGAGGSGAAGGGNGGAGGKGCKGFSAEAFEGGEFEGVLEVSVST